MAGQKYDIYGIKEDPKHGKKPNQKLKPYLVMQILMHKTDENHCMTADQIVADLEKFGVDAERRSIYRDIDDINKVLLAVDEDCTVQEAEDLIAEDETYKVVQAIHRQGFRLQQRHYNFSDIRLLMECVYAAKFISQKQADRLSKIVSEFVSDYQAEKIKHDAFLVGREKTTNNAVLGNIATINDAMSKMIDGEKHVPEKITFKYVKYDIDHMDTQSYRRKGGVYKVSPYRLLINEGNYYLLAYSDRYRDMRTYRLDRMQDVRRNGEPREGMEVFKAMDMDSFTQRVFGMTSGQRERVTLRFISPLLDTAVDRFGRKGVIYEKADDKHFTVTADVDVSEQFFAWVTGFGRRVKIIAPEPVVEKYKKHLDKVREMY